MEVPLTVVGWFGQAFIQTLIDKAGDEAIQLFAERRGFAEDMKNLRTSLLETQIILNVVQASRSNDPIWKTLIQELKEAAYDAEDLIDEFQYHVLRQKIKGEEEDKSSGSSGLSNYVIAAKKKLFGSSHSLEEDDTRARVKEIQGRLERIANSVKDIKKMLPPNDSGKQHEAKCQARETSVNPATDILFGREKELNQVIDWLLGSANQVEPASGFVNDTFSVLPIVGIGGVGKTTLAQYVHKDNRVQDHFHLKIWVCVSDNFTVRGLTKSIIQSVAPQGQYDNMGLEPLRKILHEHIAKKKFLLFLDDVWSDDDSIWENFCALLKVGAHGSKIIVTTRDKKVSEMVSLVKPISLDGLDEDVFWQLFKKCSFGTRNPEDYPELEDIGREIAGKLKGSPLAAKTLGSVLKSDLCQQHWATIMKSDISKFKKNEKSIMPVLHLSYQYLNDNLKQCFAFCSLFPKDYRFDKAELVQMWMAEGFIEDKNTKRMEDVGSDYFLEFVNMSFFQKSELGGFVMHGLIHDLAMMISGEETYRIKCNEETKIFPAILHLAVEEGKLLLEFSGYDKLRTLVLRNSPPDRLFEKLRSIRILNVSWCGLQKLSEHIGKLIHLRYLDISWNSGIKNLPDSLCDLYYLQTLRVISCWALESIPQELGKLVNLRHICADNRIWVMTKDVDVRRLTNLQELPTFSVLGDDGQKLGQLKDLTQLHGTLSIKNLQNVVDSKEAQMAELKNKIHLEELVLEWDLNWLHYKDVKLEEEVIEGLQPHKSLKILTIEGYSGGKSPSWLMPKVLSNLEKLELEDCEAWDDVLPFMGQRLHLIKLRMNYMPALKQLCHEFEGKCFPKLEVLELHELPALREWSWTEGKNLFPCMRELIVRNCRKLKRLPPIPPSLEKLTIKDCPRLRLNSKTEDDEEGGRHLPPSLKVLELSDCGEYANILPNCLHDLHLITRLEIDDCPYITSISLVQLVELQYLYISDCYELIMMEGLGLLKSLKKLKIVKCPKLVQLDVGDKRAGSLSSLCKLCVDNTALLEMLPLTFITELEIMSSSEVVIFEEAILVQSLTAVTSLTLRDCKKLQSLSLPRLLEELYIYGCPRIQAKPEKGLPTSLQIFSCLHVHPTLEEQSEKFTANKRARMVQKYGF